MTGLHPDIARMRGADSDADRAAVLLEAPVRVLMLWRQAFADTCRRAAFHEGVAYLDALADALTAPRHRGAVGTMALAGATTTLLGVIERSATVVRQDHDEGGA